MQVDICLVCNSDATVEIYSKDIDIKDLSFTYEFSPKSQRTFRVVRCLTCTHVFCAPLPKDIYKNYQDVVDKEYLKHSKTRLLTAEKTFSILKKYKSSGSLLDVGCATGDALEIARKMGYQVEGLELSRWSAKLASEKGITIYQETLKELASRFPKRYDIITLWGVIEHFQQPREEMKYLSKLLKPGGVIALWTGNVDGMMSRLLGRKWWYWQGQHIQYFTHKSLSRLGTEYGFEHLATKRYPIAATSKQMGNSLSRYSFQKYILPFIKVAFKIKRVWYLALPGEMFWIARKEGDAIKNK